MHDLQRMHNRQNTLRNWASFNNVPQVHPLRSEANPVHPAPDADQQGSQGSEVPRSADRGCELGSCRGADSGAGEINKLGRGACEGEVK